MAVIQLAEEYMTIAEAARRKGVSRTAIYDAIRKGRLCGIRISGGTTLIADKDVKAFTPRKRNRNESLKNDPNKDEIDPAKLSPLGRRLLEMSNRYIANGGRQYSAEEIRAEIAESRRYGRDE